jgi:phosphoribosylanthranilate isomerase
MKNKKIKICGITRIEDAILAKELGAWAIGFIFYDKSKRYINPTKAGEIANLVGENIEKIGVFVDSSMTQIAEFAKTANLTAIQLHGNETPEFCKKIGKMTGLPIIKALRIKTASDLQNIQEYKNSVFAILLDTYSEKEYGGTGESFDWNILQNIPKNEIPVILAGGISSENIKTAQKLVNPYAIDVSSGVESQKGIKDKEKMKKLFEINL